MEKKQRICKNKHCGKVLPKGYKYKYCEACRARQADNVKKGGKTILGVAGMVGAVAVTVITAGKINPMDK